MEPTLKALEAERLRLEPEKTVSNFAFNLNLRRHNLAKPGSRPYCSAQPTGVPAGAYNPSLLSST